MVLGLTDVLSLQDPWIGKKRDCIYRDFIKNISASSYAYESNHLSFYSFYNLYGK